MPVTVAQIESCTNPLALHMACRAANGDYSNPPSGFHWGEFIIGAVTGGPILWDRWHWIINMMLMERNAGPYGYCYIETDDEPDIVWAGLLETSSAALGTTLSIARDTASNPPETYTAYAQRLLVAKLAGE